ncbi:MAG: hypothetical protein ACOC56_01115 [Atribacterota bacterium]
MKLEFSKTGKPYIILNDEGVYENSDTVIFSDLSSSGKGYNNLVFNVTVERYLLTGKGNSAKKRIVESRLSFVTDTDLSKIPNETKTNINFDKYVKALKKILKKHTNKEGIIPSGEIEYIKEKVDNWKPKQKKKGKRIVWKKKKGKSEYTCNLDNDRKAYIKMIYAIKWFLEVYKSSKFTDRELLYKFQGKSLKECKEKLYRWTVGDFPEKLKP